MDGRIRCSSLTLESEEDTITVIMISIEVDLREIGLEVVGWIHLAQGRDRWQPFVNAVMNIQDP
jgi:hypothetical protein